jgi:DNA transformation protein and related proteins
MIGAALTMSLWVPFQYRGNKKQVTVGSYYQVPDEIADDPDALLSRAVKAREAAGVAKSKPRRRSVRRST